VNGAQPRRGTPAGQRHLIIIAAAVGALAVSAFAMLSLLRPVRAGPRASAR